ncbi:TPA: glutamate--cysteine ligase [Burkholderia cepacia]|uniref:glutamate--cysteine ligase n=1 Tax=Burkholderia cepacia TaxID=292 RepID=UPI000D2F2FA5|nr:glutamate--cysteine ligase [Burkholderia cepacia]MCA8360210.1 glutamate--cysteine ligase [Burkholderia cepacia]HDR9759626.1 glutamate--cysteine ligase [Burkholderia cepacia ATCC 25416]HDV6368182.1 glutamate--cysteine ligase [Burkholderia cepacia]
MSNATFTRRLSMLGDQLPLLGQCLRGIERESLRVTNRGHLARTPHPQALGAALTHKQITTDYSESLLEFVTPALADPAHALERLDALHRFTYTTLGDEFLWSASMPCTLPHDEEIPIAEYGSSNIGRLKHVYRKGLALRYGRAMQCIAGIHYNFSLPEGVWPLLQEAAGIDEQSRNVQSSGYMALVRNFRRYGWLLLYLFGASPAVNTRFLRDTSYRLDRFDDETLYHPYATSLRMSDLGYQSNAQAGIASCYNSLTSHIDSLRLAAGTRYPRYEAIGTHRDNEWVQLNTNILQLENEYYSSIRPKRIARAGERPIQALAARGVQYVEVRNLDVNPFLPLGIDLPEARFLDAFLLYCALDESPFMNAEEHAEGTTNAHAVAIEGRRQDLKLHRRGRSISLREWASELLAAITPVADLLDRAGGGAMYREALLAQHAKVDDPLLTPSAQVLAAMCERSIGFDRFAMHQSRLHAEFFRARALPDEARREFEALAHESMAEQARLEAQEAGDFDQFVNMYQTVILTAGDQTADALI